MDDLPRLPIDLAGVVALTAFLLVSVLLIAAGGSRLPDRWWAGALVSGLILVGISLFIVMAVSALGPGGPDGNGVRWAAIGMAGALGFLAATNVQLLIGIVTRAQGGTATVVAGAVLGPVLLIGGYLLLLRLQGTIA